MSGRDAIRGFLVQTLLCLLDGLDATNADWIAVTVEPDSASEKVDILWETPRGRKAQQVKSSQNQIGRSAVEEWCRHLAQSHEAEEYELLLAGPIAKTALDDVPFYGVRVPMPVAVNTLALLDQAITKLDRYLEAHGIVRVPLSLRESLVTLMAGHLLEGAVVGRRLARTEFDGLLLRWISSSYPEAIAHRLQTNCEVLWNEIILVAPPRPLGQTFGLVVPITFVNGGPAVAVLEWAALRVVDAARTLQMLYAPVGIVPVSAPDGAEPYAADRLQSTAGFREFAILPNAYRDIEVIMAPVADRLGHFSGLWPEGHYEITLYVKYRGVPEPLSVKNVSFNCTIDHRAVLNGKHGFRTSFVNVSI